MKIEELSRMSKAEIQKEIEKKKAEARHAEAELAFLYQELVRRDLRRFDTKIVPISGAIDTNNR